MLDGTITDLQYNGKIVELKIRIGNKESRYSVAMNIQQCSRLRKKQKCRYKTNGDQLTKLEVDGKDILAQGSGFPKGEDNRKAQRPKSDKQKRDTGPRERASQGEGATAPYNFVPINDMVVNAPVLDNEIETAEYRDENGDKRYYDNIPSFKRYHKGLYHGFINLDIEALTPLYIRAAYTLEQEKKARAVEKKGGKWENPEFFSPGGLPRIPGSSLRGMVRNLMEIASYSQLKLYDNKQFYYRKVAVRGGRYQTLMLAGSNKPTDGLRPATKAGWLKEENGQYYIYPLEKEHIYRVNFDPVADKESDKWLVNNSEESEFTFHEIRFKPTPETAHKHERIIKGNTRTNYLRYALVNDYKMGHKDLLGYEKGYLILSGRMGHSRPSHCKHMHPIIHRPRSDGRMHLEDGLIESYKGDIGREDKANLLDMLTKYPEGVPCFYTEEEETIKSIGHTPLFRLAYDKKVRDHLPEKNRDFQGLDFVTAIFGDAANFAGRVFFEDAKIVDDRGQYETLSPQILSTPKPTTTQHYLETLNTTNIADWNDSTYIRGYKMYWHRKTSRDGKYRWKANDEEINKAKKQYISIKPLKNGCRFTGCIRFENLSAEELGALLFVLDLPNGCAHKIGMGKPLGLGSIRIKPDLTLSARTDKVEGRYGRLFAGQEWHLANEPGEIDYFKDCFAEYMLEEINNNEVSTSPFKDYWNTERMKELRAMLDFDSNTKANDWLERTRYMEIERNIQKPNGVMDKKNEFKERPVLSPPLETIKAAEIKYE